MAAVMGDMADSVAVAAAAAVAAAGSGWVVHQASHAVAGAAAGGVVVMPGMVLLAACIVVAARGVGRETTEKEVPAAAVAAAMAAAHLWPCSWRDMCRTLVACNCYTCCCWCVHCDGGLCSQRACSQVAHTVEPAAAAAQVGCAMRLLLTHSRHFLVATCTAQAHTLQRWRLLRQRLLQMLLHERTQAVAAGQP